MGAGALPVHPFGRRSLSGPCPGREVLAGAAGQAGEAGLLSGGRVFFFGVGVGEIVTHRTFVTVLLLIRIRKISQYRLIRLFGGDWFGHSERSEESRLFSAVMEILHTATLRSE